MTDDRRKQNALGERDGGGFQRGDQVEQAALLFQLRLLCSVGSFQRVRLFFDARLRRFCALAGFLRLLHFGVEHRARHQGDQNQHHINDDEHGIDRVAGQDRPNNIDS